MDGAVGEQQRERRVIGAAFGPKVLQNGKIGRAVGIGDAAAQRLARRVNGGEWAFPKVVGVENPNSAFDVVTPVSACHKNLRPMTSGWSVVTNTATRHSGTLAFDQSLAQLRQNILRNSDPKSRLRQATR